MLKSKHKSDLTLPKEISQINVLSRMTKYDEDKNLLHISSLVDDYFKKRKKFPLTQAEMKKDNGWEEVGIKPSAISYEKLIEKIKLGKAFDTQAYIPNDSIYGNSLHNRTDEINFTSVINHLDIRNGLFWQAINITVVVYPMSDGSYKFVTVIGNHCTVKSILVFGKGTHLPARVIFLGPNLKEAMEYGYRIHHTDSDRRTNMKPEHRLISGVRSKEKEYQETMKVLVGMGFDLKGQVIGNNKKISSTQALIGLVKEFDYDVVYKNVELLREIFPNEKATSTKALEVMTNITHYFDKKVEPHWKSFMEAYAVMHTVADIYPHSTDNKNGMIPTVQMIEKLNHWVIRNTSRKQKLISKKDIYNNIPENKLENVCV